MVKSTSMEGIRKRCYIPIPQRIAFDFDRFWPGYRVSQGNASERRARGKNGPANIATYPDWAVRLDMAASAG